MKYLGKSGDTLGSGLRGEVCDASDVIHCDELVGACGQVRILVFHLTKDIFVILECHGLQLGVQRRLDGIELRLLAPLRLCR